MVVGFTRLIDAFPAFESCAAYGDWTKTLFTAPPPHGHLVANLLGGANRFGRAVATVYGIAPSQIAFPTFYAVGI